MASQGWLVVFVAAAACSNDPTHHLADSGTDSSSATHDAGSTNDGGSGSGSGSQVAALGCDPAQLALDCPATLAVTTKNMSEAAFTMTLGSGATSYDYEITDAPVAEPFDRHYTLTCATGSDNVRGWQASFSDSCESTNDIGNFTADHSGASFTSSVGTCPSGAYTATAEDDGDPFGGSTTCEQPGSNAEIDVTAP
jgi:hypothetical protein